MISDIARADGIHDFDKEFGPTGKNLTVFNASVPIASQTELNEDKCMDAVLGSGSREKLRALRPELGPIQGLDAGIQGIPILGRKFSLKTQEASELAQRIGFDQRGAGLVVDFNQHGFLARLKRGAPNPIQIYYLLTPEVVNDPAPKTTPNERIFKLPGGLGVVPCIEFRDTPITFPGNEPFDNTRDPHTLFFSKYTHSLSPIRDVSAAGIPKKLKVDLTITDGAKTTNIKDSKLQNSIEMLKKGLKKFLALFRGEDPMSIATKWTQKRGGDWFQAIAALDIRGRKFINPLSTDPTPKEIPNIPVYFVTHDRIALAYALLIGCNAIFLSVDEDECYAFTRERNVDLSKFYADELAKITTIEERKQFLTKEVSSLRGNIDTRVQEIDTLIGTLETIPDIERLQTACRSILTKLIEVAGMNDTMVRYDQANTGLNETDGGKKYASYMAIKDAMPYDLKTLTDSDIYKTANKWMWSYITDRSKATLETKLGIYEFLEYIAELPDSQTIKGKVAQTFWSLAKRIQQRTLPAIGNIRVERTQEKASIGFASLFTQVYVYLGHMQSLEDAQLLMNFATYVPKDGENYNPIEVSELQSDIVNSDGNPAFIPVLQTLITAANGAIEEDDMEQRPLKQLRQQGGLRSEVHPLTPILAVLIAMDSMMGPDLQNSPDLPYIQRFIELLYEFGRRSPTPEHRVFLWEFLNPTDIDLAMDLGIPQDEFLPYELMIQAFSNYLFGTFEVQASNSVRQNRGYVQRVWKKIQSAPVSDYTNVMKRYGELRKYVFDAIAPSTSTMELENIPMKPKLVSTTDIPLQQPIAVAKRPRGDEGGRRTQRRKPKRSKSSRRTKRAHRLGRAKGSERRSSR